MDAGLILKAYQFCMRLKCLSVKQFETLSGYPGKACTVTLCNCMPVF